MIVWLCCRAVGRAVDARRGHRRVCGVNARTARCALRGEPLPAALSNVATGAPHPPTIRT